MSKTPDKYPTFEEKVADVKLIAESLGLNRQINENLQLSHIELSLIHI